MGAGGQGFGGGGWTGSRRDGAWRGGSGGGGKVYGGVELCGGIVGRAGRNCATSNTVLGANIPKFQNATNIEELKIFFGQNMFSNFFIFLEDHVKGSRTRVSRATKSS